MNLPPVCIYGAGGHAKVIANILKSNNISLAAHFDDDTSVVESSNEAIRPGIGILGEDFVPPEHPFVLAIGTNRVREKLSGLLNVQFSTVIDGTSVIAQDVSVGEGSVVFALAVIQPDVQIGRHVIVNTKASIDHDSVIGDFVHVAPGATLCGGVVVQEGAHIGAGATIIEGVKIGKWATIGAGSVVIRDVPDFLTVAGCPAKPLPAH